MIQTVLQLVFTIYEKRLKYIPKNEIQVSVHAKDCAKHIALQYLLFQTTGLKSIKYTGTWRSNGDLERQGIHEDKL